MEVAEKMLPDTPRRESVFFWDENGRVGKGWTTGKPLATGWLEVELARGIRESCAGSEQVPVERVLSTTVGMERNMGICSTAYLQKILDQLIARNPLLLLRDCLKEEWQHRETSLSVFPRDPGFWQRWEWMQMLVLRHPPQQETASFSVVEREFAIYAAQELERRYGGAATPYSVRMGEYAGQLPCLAVLETQMETTEGLRIDFLAQMVSHLVRCAETDLSRRMVGEKVKDPFLFHLLDFVSAYPGEVDVSALTQWLAARSVVPGEWGECSPASLQREHPLRLRPLIRLEEEWYAWPLVGGAARHVWDWLFDPGKDEEVSANVRGAGETVCNRAISMFQQAFPGADVYKRVYWRNKDEDSDEGMLDAVIRIPPFLFALRTEAPLWGETEAPSAVKREGLNELATLRRAWNNRTLSLKTGAELIPTQDARLVEMMLTLEPWENIGFQAGFPPIYSLSELQNLFYLLDGSARKADYLWKRVNARRVGEEWQRLSAYWLTGSPDRQEAGPGSKCKGRGLEPFLPYLERAWQGKRVTAIEDGYTHWWNAILRKLEQSRAPESLWIGTHLVGVDLGTQNRFERQVKRLKKEICHGAFHSHSVVFNDIYRVAGAIVDPEQERDHPIHLRHRELRKRLMSRDGPWVLISFNRDDSHYPYSDIQLLL